MATSAAAELVVLLVEDVKITRTVIRALLSKRGIQCLEAENGAKAVEIIQAQGDKIDFVLMDINMPVLSGYEMTAAIREKEREQGLPRTLILGFTANAQPSEKARCIEAGMDDCLFKPIRLADLAAWLAARFCVEPKVASIESPGAWPEIDLSGLQHYVGEDHELIEQLLRDLVLSNRTDRDELLKAHASHDESALCALAHRIKGGALMVRAQTLIECCVALERACGEGRTAQIDGAVDVLQQAMTHLEQRLAQG